MLAGLIFSLGGSLILFVAFCLIRPRNNVVYAPRIKYHEGKKPKPLGQHPLSWMKLIFKVKEHELVEHIGIDAVLYIRFMTMCRNLFLIFSVVGCLVMIPINVVYNLKSPMAENASKSDAFVLMTPTLLYGNTLYAHIVVTWIFDAVICFFLWRNFNKIIDLRRNKFKTEEYQNALFMRTLMATEIPKKYDSDDGLILLMSTLKVTRPIQNASVGRDVTVLTKLIDKYSKAVMKLESVLAKYLKNPQKLPAQRPLCKPFKDDRARESMRGKVDAIDYLCNRITQLEKQIETIRETIDSNKLLPYGFISYESVEDCHTVAQSTRQKRKGKLNASLAPRPVDIIWDNIVLTRMQRSSKEHWGNFLFVLLMIGWIVPNAFLGTFLSNLSRIGSLWSPFNTFMYNYPVFFSILQGVLSPIVMSLIFLILPAIMRRMSQWQGKVTKHEREINVTKKLYTFFVFNNLFVFTVFSVVWTMIAKIIDLVNNGHDLSFDIVMDELNLAQQLSTAILSASSFWVMYILRVNFGTVLDLLQLFSLLWRGFQRHFMSPTPRELMLWTAPQHFNFAAYYNWMLFYTTIALCFSMVQPLILPVISFYFILDVIFKKYSLMYIFVTKAETDGLYWPFLFNAMLFATGFGNAVLFTVVWVQGGWQKAVCLAPLLPLLIIFKIVSRRTHNNRFYYFIPTAAEQEEMAAARTRTNLSDISHGALVRRYRNPAITGKLIVPMVHSKAQHLLPQICSLDGRSREEADMETAFIGMDDFDDQLDDNHMMTDPYEGYKMDTLRSGDNVNNSKGGFMDGRFDIVNENDLTYERYQEIEKARMATPFNPYLTQETLRRESPPPVPPLPAAYDPQKEHSHPYLSPSQSYNDLSTVNSYTGQYYDGQAMASHGVIIPTSSYNSYRVPSDGSGAPTLPSRREVSGQHEEDQERLLASSNPYNTNPYQTSTTSQNPYEYHGTQ